MNALLTVPMILIGATAERFQRHEIDEYPAGYQVAVADINGDGRLDVIALSTDGNRVDWFENPTWRRRPVARVERPIDLAVHDLDGDGKPEIALASGFHFNDSMRGGQIQWLKPRASLDEPWQIHPIAADPVVHRLRWADLDGDGKKELLHAPIFGPGSKANIGPKPSHLWAFRVPADPAKDPWPIWKIDETLTVLHGLWVGKPSGSAGPEVLLTASFEGIYRFSYHKTSGGTWEKSHEAPGAGPVDARPGAARGSSEVALGRCEAPGLAIPGFLAAIEPWHGNQVVVYWRGVGGCQRVVLDDTLAEGHALVAADFDGDGRDEIVAGWRGAGGGLNLYDRIQPGMPSCRITPIDRGIAVEGAVAADLNADGQLDLVVIAGKTNNLVWYENK